MILTGKKYILAAWLMFAGLNMLAQQTSRLKGKVVDEDDGQPVVGASVQIMGTYKGTVTDFDGNYLIDNLKPGDYTIKVQGMGYGTMQYNGISIKEGQTTTLNVKMSSDREMLQTVTVVGRRAQVDLEVAASEVSFTAEEISKLNVRNVEELVATQAGVMQTQDGIQIRGARV